MIINMIMYTLGQVSDLSTITVHKSAHKQKEIVMEKQELQQIFETNGTLEENEIAELFEIIENLENQLKSKMKGRKQEVFDCLKEFGPLSIKKISDKLGISTKNVSSQLTYLKQEGVKIFTDDNGKKFIHE